MIWAHAKLLQYLNKQYIAVAYPNDPEALIDVSNRMNLKSNYLHALIKTMREENLEWVIDGVKQDMFNDILEFYGEDILQSENFSDDLEFIVQSIESVMGDNE